MAEWVRRWIANPLLFERESSNLSDVVLLPGLFNILVTELNVICTDGLLPAMESTPTPKDIIVTRPNTIEEMESTLL